MQLGAERKHPNTLLPAGTGLTVLKLYDQNQKPLICPGYSTGITGLLPESNWPAAAGQLAEAALHTIDRAVWF